MTKAHKTSFNQIKHFSSNKGKKNKIKEIHNNKRDIKSMIRTLRKKGVRRHVLLGTVDHLPFPYKYNLPQDHHC